MFVDERKSFLIAEDPERMSLTAQVWALLIL